MSGLERNRGVYIKRRGDGLRVAMYHDEPGVYYDINGERVDDSIAAKAGFDVAGNARERKKQESRRSLSDMFEIQFDEAQERLERLMDDEPNISEKLDIKKKNNKYVLVAGGHEITNQPADWEECAMVYKALAGKPYQAKQTGGRGKGGKKANQGEGEGSGGEGEGEQGSGEGGPGAGSDASSLIE